MNGGLLNEREEEDAIRDLEVKGSTCIIDGYSHNSTTSYLNGYFEWVGEVDTITYKIIKGLVQDSESII